MDRKAVWDEEFSVRSFEADYAGRLKLSSLFNYFQEIAGHHAAHLWVGYDGLKKLGYYWVLSRARVMIHRLPAWGETVKVTTWPRTPDNLFFLRDFHVEDQRHETLAVATTAWLLLESTHLKPQTAADIPVTFPTNDRQAAFTEPLKKLKPFALLRNADERRVMLSDLDVNNHVNNARYVDWIVDSLGSGESCAKSIRALQVNYLGQATLGDVVRISRGDEPPPAERSYVEGVDAVKGSKVVQALIEWA